MYSVKFLNNNKELSYDDSVKLLRTSNKIITIWISNNNEKDTEGWSVQVKQQKINNRKQYVIITDTTSVSYRKASLALDNGICFLIRWC